MGTTWCRCHSALTTSHVSLSLLNTQKAERDILTGVALLRFVYSLSKQRRLLICLPLFVVEQIIGPKADAGRIPGIDIQVADGDTWQFGGLEMKVFDTPGHTRGHISFWLPEAKALFCGKFHYYIL